MTIGILLTGSIKRPRMVISTSIAISYGGDVFRPLGVLCFLYHHFAQKAVGKTCRCLHLDVASYRRSCHSRCREVQSFVLRGAPDPLGAGFVSPFNHYFYVASYVFLVARDLYFPLSCHQDLKSTG